MKILNKSRTAAPLTQEARTKRRFYLVLPILILPFMTLAFWALGGGRDAGTDKLAPVNAGLNTTLPDASIREEKPSGKLELYRQAGGDTSAVSGISRSLLAEIAPAGGPEQAGKINPEAASPADAQSARLEEKLAQLNRQLQTPPAKVKESTHLPPPAEDRSIQKLRSMIQTAGGPRQTDPEMQQISKVLSQLQALQHPGSPKAETSSPSGSEKAFQAIKAVVDGKQKIADGATLRIRLSDSVTLKRQILPKGQLLFGICRMMNQRLLVSVKNIRLNDQIIPADLTIYSLDGMPGIPAPEAELVNAAGDGAQDALAQLQVLTADQSVGAQAAASGINAVKGLFRKKIKKIKVKVRDGMVVLLRDNQQRNR
jgi:conjugative transposon TraM protein